MPNIEPILEFADGKTQQLLQSAEGRIGQTSNMLRTMAHSGGVLDAYLHFNHVYEQARITTKLRGLITAAIAEALGGEYILSVAAALGTRQGITLDELEEARRGQSKDGKIAVALRLAVEAVKAEGKVDLQLMGAMRDAGYSEEETVEIIGFIGLNLFRNYFNLIAGTAVDFPCVRVGEPIGKGIAQPAHSARG